MGSEQTVDTSSVAPPSKISYKVPFAAALVLAGSWYLVFGGTVATITPHECATGAYYISTGSAGRRITSLPPELAEQMSSGSLRLRGEVRGEEFHTEDGVVLHFLFGTLDCALAAG